MPLPNFFLIGAQKAGTTALSRSLAQHPDIYMSPVKEPMYFGYAPGAHPPSPPGMHIVSTIDEYRSLFAGVRDERVIGEASTSYLRSPEAAARIRDTVPDARLVAVLRNPVDRALSRYSQLFSEGVESRSFSEAIGAELAADAKGELRGTRYLWPGFYGRHLTTYLSLFERRQLDVHVFEDLEASPQRLLTDIFRFLDVDPTFVPRVEHANVTRYQPRSRAAGSLLRRILRRARARAVAAGRPSTASQRSHSRRGGGAPAVPRELRFRLAALYREDVERTGDLIGRDLSSWIDH